MAAIDVAVNNGSHDPQFQGNLVFVWLCIGFDIPVDSLYRNPDHMLSWKKLWNYKMRC
jgi:hypothetical protein